MDSMMQKNGDIGSSKYEAGDGKPLETCNVDFGPYKKMECFFRLGMVNMLYCEEQIVKCLEQNRMTELFGQGIGK